MDDWMDRNSAFMHLLLPAQAVEAGGKPQESTETVTYQTPTTGDYLP